MKKILPVIMCLCIAVTCFAACSSTKTDTKAEKTTAAATTEEKAGEITTDKAKITDANAINYIQSYSNEDLGLTKEDLKECKFMVASSGEKVDGAYYVKVIATVPTEHKDKEGKVTYTFDNKGEYYINYEGTKVLKRDVKTGKYSEIKFKEFTTTKAAETTVATTAKK